jgi:3-keto-disaccharide hydrolase
MSRTLLLLLAVSCPLALATLVSGARSADKPESVALYNGKDLTGWKVKGSPAKIQWIVGKAALDEKNPSKLTVTDGSGNDLINPHHAGDLFTEQKFGDGTFEVEFMIPKGSNSGVYLMGEYEIQILDSFGKAKVGPGDMGGLYSTAAPKVNACKKPGEWQKFVLEYQTPRFDQAGKKTANFKLVKATLNGEVIHENVECKGPTGGSLTGKESTAGPLMFQGDHGPVVFRSVKFTPAAKK